MAGSTNRLGMYKAGGGSSGSYPDEVIDVDRHNDNFDKLDEAVGAPGYTSASRPVSPYDGQLIWETDTEKLKRYSTSSGTWVDAVVVQLPYVQATEPSGAVAGELWFW